MASNAMALDARSVIALKTRYADAYKIARTTIKLGSMIKLIGMIVAGLIALAAIVSELGTPRSQSLSAFGTATQGSMESAIMIGIAVAVAVVIGLLFFILGTYACAQGQILLASLDGAVNSSPFLDNAAKANVLLGHATASSGMFTTSMAH